MLQSYSAAFVLTGLFTGMSFAQTQTVSQTFQLNSTDTKQSMVETVNAVRTILEIPDVTLDENARTVTASSTPANLALAAWLVDQLEAPAAGPGQDTGIAQNPGPAGPSDRIYVYHLAHTSSVRTYNQSAYSQAQSFQEAVNAVRTIPEMTKAFPRSATYSIAVRGSEDRLALATWLVQQIDQPMPPPGQVRTEQKVQTNIYRNPSEGAILYVAHDSGLYQFQAIVNAIRTIPELTKVFPVAGKGAIALAGEPDRIALAEWLFGQMDLAGPQNSFSTSSTYAFGANTVQVFFMPASVSEQSFTDAVNNIKALKLTVFPVVPTRTLAVRGAASQLSQAEQIVKTNLPQ